MSEKWKIRQTRGNNRHEYTLYRPLDDNDIDVIAEIEFTDAETAKEVACLLAAAPAMLTALKNLLEDDLLLDKYHIAGRQAITSAQ
ncbi:MAG TPA: hypothetical protein ENI27_02605 [bacterium]|nr:hypothetical protein [bacterium]